MRPTPVVLLAYNRPDKVERLIASLRSSKPKHILFAVDGPKIDNQQDISKVQKVQKLVELIDWNAKVETLFRPTNLGLRRAVIEAVSTAVSQYGQAIIIEEDTIPGPLWLPYAEYNLAEFRRETTIEHISGHNQVPNNQISVSVGSRLTRYPASIAWATWDRAWENFDESLEWAHNVSIPELSKLLGTTLGALKWKQNFSDAENSRISTWAYRWIASMWSRGAYVLSPNQNLVTYNGFDVGSNSFMKAAWSDLPLENIELDAVMQANPVLDPQAEEWVNKIVFSGTMYGISRGVAISIILEARKQLRELSKG